MISARWWPAISWALLVDLLLVWPRPPRLPDGMEFDGSDKFVHAALFGVLAWLIARPLAVRGQRAWFAAVAASAFGAITEVQQHFIPTRSMELGDFLADTAGAVMALAVFTVWARQRREFSR